MTTLVRSANHTAIPTPKEVILKSAHGLSSEFANGVVNWTYPLELIWKYNWCEYNTSNIFYKAMWESACVREVGGVGRWRVVGWMGIEGGV